ncbi:MAG: gamma-glutamylcyclotransferase [Candidatus Aenigmarchaeota archaeon]|nr:gamma-glutamylcyclotransferase [Candidatus Aenigmarchaeota archaeon]
MKRHLFVYGTLKSPKIQKSVFGRITKGRPDVLEGYKKSKIMIDKKRYPILIPNKRSLVKGLVISVTPDELKTIDKYETDSYKRTQIVLKSGKIAWVYQK